MQKSAASYIIISDYDLYSFNKSAVHTSVAGDSVQNDIRIA